eukprot:2581570-Amphidinium_carterae.1
MHASDRMPASTLPSSLRKQSNRNPIAKRFANRKLLCTVRFWVHVLNMLGAKTSFNLIGDRKISSLKKVDVASVSAVGRTKLNLVGGLQECFCTSPNSVRIEPLWQLWITYLGNLQPIISNPRVANSWSKYPLSPLP